MNIAMLIAGGKGVRMNQDIPKQFLNIKDKPVIIYTLQAFQQHPEIDEIAVVCIDGWQTILQAYANQFNITKLKWIVTGGENGQESIKNGVMELQKHYKEDDIVLMQFVQIFLRKSYPHVLQSASCTDRPLRLFRVRRQCF